MINLAAWLIFSFAIQLLLFKHFVVAGVSVGLILLDSASIEWFRLCGIHWTVPSSLGLNSMIWKGFERV